MAAPISSREDFKWLVAGSSILALHAGESYTYSNFQG